MKKQKLNLDTLQVKSFVTDLKNADPNTVKAGNGFFSIFGCNSGLPTCTCPQPVDRMSKPGLHSCGGSEHVDHCPHPI